MKKDKRFLCCMLALSALAPGHAFAQSTPSSVAGGWNYTLGVGAMRGPTYPGSGDTHTKGFPVLGATYGRFFAGAADVGVTVPVGIGYNLVQDQHWKVGIGVGYDIYSVRKESDNAAKLRGLGDIERTVRTSVFAKYSNGGMSLFGAVVSSAKGQGTQVKLGADAAHSITPSLIVNAGPSVTWANARSNQTFYGISAAQSANSGRSRYSPSAGVSDVTFSAGLTYLLSPSWSLGSRISVSYLPDTVSDSPIVDKDITTSYGVFTAYRF
ncbi:MipA/OmpV family protein [Herbaspirillum sp. LeCh32-8]|uniref:MipA/OmpV family protein n=1 Tax=Herbaspirillum sp. LeCh32-8 TaxID=2821356 RepID=UPI001AE76D91|nr:MipA/OmpV family protein [Herbaspirillum sp. LeCh32-8]MBP0598135.1 MipA/OmpV family protein [Herbaspirillum sp. LeCh32-8]